MEWAYKPRVQVVGHAPRVEGLTAGMARISRDPTPIPELVRQARQSTAVARSRNERIVYEYGHNSIAEHGGFSLAVWDIPRLLSLHLVGHRLAAYTQQSGRYIPFERVPRQFFLPREYRRGRARAVFTEAVAQSYALYTRLYADLTEYLLRANPGLKRGMAERRATEDARYVLPLAQTTQIGMTTNAREWALVMSRLLSHPLSEFQRTGEALFRTLHPLAPSLFPEKYIQARAYPASGQGAVVELAARLGAPSPAPAPVGDVALVEADPLGERRLAALLLLRTTRLGHAERQAAVERWTDEEVGQIITASLTGWLAHDTAPREFEAVVYQFELVLSEAAFHQLIRHRMATQILQGHAADLGYTVPPLVAEAGCEGAFREGIDRLSAAFQALGADQRAEIILSNAHHLRVVVQLSARELIEMSRVRADEHAQWDVRETMGKLVELVSRVHPHLGAACGGRDAFKSGAVLAGAAGAR